MKYFFAFSFFLLPLISLSAQRLSQSLLIRTNGQVIEAKNDYGHSYTVKFLEGKRVLKKQVISHRESLSYDPGKALSQSAAKRYSITAEYDEAAYQNDMSILRQMKQARIRRRQNDAIFFGIIAGLDEYFFKGLGGKIFGGLSLLQMLDDRSLSTEEKAEKMLESLLKNKATGSIKDRRLRSLVVGGMTTMENLMEDGNDMDLVKSAAACTKRLIERPAISTEKLVKYMSFYPRYSFYIGAAYPFSPSLNEFRFTEYEDGDELLDFTSFSGDLSTIPLTYEIKNRWLLAPTKSKKSTTYFQLIFFYQRSPVFYKKNNFDQEFKQGIGQQITTMGAEFGWGLRTGKRSKGGLDFQFAIGPNLNRSREVSFTGEEPGSMGQELQYGGYSKSVFALSLALEAGIDIKAFRLFGRYRGIIALDSNDEDISSLSINGLHAGIQLPLFRSWRVSN